MIVRIEHIRYGEAFKEETLENVQKVKSIKRFNTGYWHIKFKDENKKALMLSKSIHRLEFEDEH